MSAVNYTLNCGNCAEAGGFYIEIIASMACIIVILSIIYAGSSPSERLRAASEPLCTLLRTLLRHRILPHARVPAGHAPLPVVVFPAAFADDVAGTATIAGRGRAGAVAALQETGTAGRRRAVDAVAAAG